MGLDIRIIQRRSVLCPCCGKEVCSKDIECQESGGKAWYDILESIGYYVPYEQRTEENDWYGKDMTLSKANAAKMRSFVMCNNETIYNGKAIANLIAAAICDSDDVVINADW